MSDPSDSDRSHAQSEGDINQNNNMNRNSPISELSTPPIGNEQGEQQSSTEKTELDKPSKDDGPNAEADAYRPQQLSPETKTDDQSQNSSKSEENDVENPNLPNETNKNNEVEKLEDSADTGDSDHDQSEELRVKLPPLPSTARTEADGVATETGSAASQSNDNKDTQVEEGATAAESGNGESIYHIKWIHFKKKLVPIITQNENGPCPLLAILNVLLLQTRVKLASQMEFISAGQLMAHLGECMFDSIPNDEGMTASSRLNFEQNMQDAMAVMPMLQTGLDVNVKFTGVKDFEYTQESIIFDLLQIALYHGWLVDPQNQPEVQAVGKCSYNQLVEKIITQKTSEQTEVVSQALLAEQFLETSASQLTYHGLSELCTQLKDDELAVLFRNNHFTTLYRHKDELFQLVTDQGFLTESKVVWETLCNVEGDGHFVDSDFRNYTKPEPTPVEPSNLALNSTEQIDQDYLVALSLQQEQQQPDNSNWNQPGPQLSDLELAQSLQEEERRAALAEEEHRGGGPEDQAAARRQPNPQPTQRPRNRQTADGQRDREDKKSDCCIL